MAQTLTFTLTASTVWSMINALDLSSPTDAKTTSWTGASLSNGTGINAANQLWHDERTLSSSASEVIDLFDFAIDAGSAQKDSLGSTLAMVKLKGLLIYNTSLVAGEILKIGAEGSTASWQSMFHVSGTASDTAGAVVGPGGLFIATNPSAAGFTVADATNHLLKIANAGSSSITYRIVVVGANA